jgi:hypothetical protein
MGNPNEAVDTLPRCTVVSVSIEIMYENDLIRTNFPEKQTMALSMVLTDLHIVRRILQIFISTILHVSAFLRLEM